MHVRHRRPVKLLLYCWTPFPTKDIVLDAPTASWRARKRSGSERRSGLNLLQFGYLGTFQKFQKIWKISKLTLSHKTQELGGQVTLERTLTRLKIIFRSVVGNSDSTSKIKEIEIATDLGTFGNFGELWGTFGNFWELSQNFRKL